MLKTNKALASVIISAVIGASLNLVYSSKVSAASNRIWGQDRYQTSVAISKQGWTSSDYVIVASGEGYADALCAAPLAKKLNAPVLLTEGSELNADVKDQIVKLGARHVIIIGMYGSVSKNAENELSSVVKDVERIGGNDRYETSVMVAEKLDAPSGIVVTSGRGYADALSIAPVAASSGMPILLTEKDSLSQEVNSYISKNASSLKNFYVVGGNGVISDSAAAQISKTAIRLSGNDRFETNEKVLTYFKSSLNFDNVYIAQGDGPTGNEFADALSGSALAAKTSSPIILTYNTISKGLEDIIKANAKSSSNLVALGGTAAVPDSILSDILKDVSGGGGQSKPGGNPGGGAGGGSDTGNTTNQELTSIVGKLNSLYKDLATENEKNIVSQVTSSINKVIADPAYDYKKDSANVKILYNSLTKVERDDLDSLISKNISMHELLELQSEFGL